MKNTRFDPASLERRRLSNWLGDGLVAGGVASAAPPTRDGRFKTPARIVIAGGSLAGIAIAARLRRASEGATIVIVDAQQAHNCQPGFTPVATAAKKSVPPVAADLLGVLAGRESSARCDGDTPCPLIVREGSAMLIEFDCQGRLTLSFLWELARMHWPLLAAIAGSWLVLVYRVDWVNVLAVGARSWHSHGR